MAALLLVVLGPARAEQSPSPQQNPQIEPARQQMQMEKARQQMAQVQKQMAEARRQNLEGLRQINPKLYEEQKAAADREERIESLLARFHEGTLSEAQARAQLEPLLSQRLKPEFDALPAQIARFEKKLDFLRRASKDRNLFVRKRLDQMLGTRTSKPAAGPGQAPMPPDILDN